MGYCTDRNEDMNTCLGYLSCDMCPYWSVNRYKKLHIDDDEENDINYKKHKKNSETSKCQLKYKDNCKNYGYWCGKLHFLLNCENCELYENEL